MLMRTIWTTALGFALVAGTIGSAVSAAPEAGRYKKQGTQCLWDSKDSGPNQCAPMAAGRFKKNGATCAWSANDTGADECRPAEGRFKKEGSSCVWTASDKGPDQCDPRRAK